MFVLPPSVAAVVADEPMIPLSGCDPSGDQGWVDHTWPGRSWIAGSFLVRQADSSAVRVVDDELSRLEWLGLRQPAAPLVVAEGDWLIVDLGSATPSHRPELQAEPDMVPTLLGRALRRLHDLDTGSCPFRRPWTDVIAELSSAVERGSVRSDRLRAPYDRYEPAQLLELIAQGRPASEDDVVAHGGAVLSNIALDPRGDALFVGVHRLGVADRHLDLAVITNQLQLAFGLEALYGFYEGYGRDPDLVRLDHFILIDALASAIHSDPGPEPA